VENFGELNLELMELLLMAKLMDQPLFKVTFELVELIDGKIWRAPNDVQPSSASSKIIWKNYIDLDACYN
jgi:hypothetical protein